MTKINPRNIEIRNYDYDLPDERIAKYPLSQRDQSKLLVWHPATASEAGDKADGTIEERHFFELPDQIPAGSMIVFNNTKVIQARLHFRKPTGGVVEVFCLEPEAPKTISRTSLRPQNASGLAWWAIARSGRKEVSLFLSVCPMAMP